MGKKDGGANKRRRAEEASTSKDDDEEGLLVVVGHGSRDEGEDACNVEEHRHGDGEGPGSTEDDGAASDDDEEHGSNQDEEVVAPSNDGGVGSNNDGTGQVGDTDADAPNNEEEDSDGDEDQDRKSKKKKKKEKKKEKKAARKKLSLKSTQDFNAKLRRRGVLYLSRIPPRMGPAKVKSLLSDFGPVTRVYLVEEDKAARKRRRRQAGGGGGGGKRYTEGWVEFESKSIAKMVGERLNNTPISNHKRSVHYGDLWNVKYLRNFKWEHLTERVAYERRVREQKMRVELMHARRENAAFAERVERGMVMDRIEERRAKRKKRRGSGDGDGDGDGDVVEGEEGERRPTRKFRQTAVVDEAEGGPAKSAVLGSLV